MTTGSVFIAQAGEGVPLLKGHELNRGIIERIERLGKMNDRRRQLEGRRDRKGLLALAEEYESLGRYGCPRLAQDIRSAAKGLKVRQKSNKDKELIWQQEP